VGAYWVREEKRVGFGSMVWPIGCQRAVSTRKPEFIRPHAWRSPRRLGQCKVQCFAALFYFSSTWLPRQGERNSVLPFRLWERRVKESGLCHSLTNRLHQKTQLNVIRYLGGIGLNALFYMRKNNLANALIPAFDFTWIVMCFIRTGH